MDWMSDALDRFYSTATDEHADSLPIKNEHVYSLDVTVGDLYSADHTSLTNDAEIGAALNASGVSHGSSQMGPRVSKECGVCGDKALGYNFNAITCESCKAFFRRNALKTKDFRCPFNDMCTIDTVTRRFCQKCRLKKCYAIGMKKEWIMTDDEKRKKRRKTCDNRPRRNAELTSAPSIYCYNSVNDDCANIEGVTSCTFDISGADVTQNSDMWSSNSPVSPYSSSTLTSPDLTGYQPLMATNGDDPESPVTQSSSNVCPLSAALTSLTGSVSVSTQPSANTVYDYSPAQPVSTRDVGVQVHRTDASQEYSKLNLMSIMHVAVRSEFCGWHETEVPSTELSHAERARIHELLDAQQTLMAPLNEDNVYVNLVNKDPSLINVINLCDIAIRRLIQMSKKMASFRALCQRDQIALLKGGCTELMILRSVTTYDIDNNSWNIQASESEITSIKLNVLKNAPHDVCEQHRQFNLSFRSQWKSDPFIMGLLSAIALFSPDRVNLEHREAVSLEQECYCYLLRRYLRTSMPACSANTEFVRLTRKLDELRRLNTVHVKLFMDVDPRHIEPLLIEIFDLNHTKPGCHHQNASSEPSIDSIITF